MAAANPTRDSPSQARKNADTRLARVIHLPFWSRPALVGTDLRSVRSSWGRTSGLSNVAGSSALRPRSGVTAGARLDRPEVCPHERLDRPEVCPHGSLNHYDSSPGAAPNR